jgi:predicted peptidase
MIFPTLLLALGALFMAQPSESINVEPGKQLPQSLQIKVRDATRTINATMHYQLFTPQDYKPTGKKWPLMLFLHGLGECGDNQLDLVKIHGPANIVDTRADFPFVVVTPQLPPIPGYDPDAKIKQTPEELLALVGPAWKPDQLIQLLDHVEENLNIDPQRVYVTGLSMGGFGTWRLVAEYPERFAAAVPICGGGEPAAMATSLRRVPIWAFHGARDPLVPLRLSHEMVHAVRCAGGDVRLTVYPDIEHNSWKPTYDNPEVYEWLLSHRGPL